jgi:hypothetical protein
MVIPELATFALVGGTNLSLQLGHRLSVDIDLFTNRPFNMERVKQAIHQEFPRAARVDEMKQTIWYEINGVKTDPISIKMTEWGAVKHKITVAVTEYIKAELKQAS